MADQKNRYQEKTNPVLQVLYVIVILALVTILFFLYRNWQDQRRMYDTLVQEAVATEVDYDIENRKLQNTEIPKN